MSAYASLPGSFLPPFFSFGASSSSSPPPSTKSECVDTTLRSVPSNSSSPEDPLPTSQSTFNRNNNLDSKNDCTASSIDSDGVPSDVAAAAAALQSSASPTATTTTSSSRPSDIIIAIRSARVDPVALIKSLTFTGSNIARRTASFIVRTPDIATGSTVESSASVDGVGGEREDKEGGGSSDRSSVISRPGLCYEDSDSEDEEFSMYDYSDDFSSPNNDDDNIINNNSIGYRHEEEEEQQQQPLTTNSTADGGSDPSAIQFELSITFQGRKYNATRGFPTFVKLREDLLHELKNNNDRRTCRRYHHLGGTRSSSPSADGGIHADSYTKKVESFVQNDCHNKSSPSSSSSDNESLSVPELPRVSPESLGHGGGSYALYGVARSGFALLQATAQHYCPEMERWMRHVIEAFPCSQSLSSFLWEPLSSSNASWETIGEEEGGSAKSNCGNNDLGQQTTGKMGSVHDASTVFTKPPLHTRMKPKCNNNFSKTSRYKSMGSVGSLNSIEEDDGNDCDDDRR
jgi:hypothetical protein